MTNTQLEEKFRRQAVRALPLEQVERLIERCWRVDAVEDVGEAIVGASVPALAGVQPSGA
jgi:hypothetical protein